nr:MAG TPA: hypothetical protein [Bacteriophage sp.]DAN23324.1 MAG TPA_asm: hypothetical protein [Bacteriophage sp.]DAU52535.1 MAG TPA: hypothetical protein [Crassvirales sp.]
MLPSPANDPASFTPYTGISDPCLLSLPSPPLYDDIFIFLASIY